MGKSKKGNEKQRSTFKLFGGYEIMTPEPKYFDQETSAKYFWTTQTMDKNDLPKIRNEFGVYIFYRKAGDNHVPFYIGKTNQKKGFEGEIFQAGKIVKYNNSTHPKNHNYVTAGKYYMMFLVLQRKRLKSGKLAVLNGYNKKHIRALEKQMIGQGFIKNPFIQNIQDKENGIPKWQIDDMVGKGRMSIEAKAFSKLFEQVGTTH